MITWIMGIGDKWRCVFQDIAEQIQQMNYYEDRMIKKQTRPDPAQQLWVPNHIPFEYNDTN